MSKTLIKAFPEYKLPTLGQDYLRVSEFFWDTIQGEGFNTGVPAAFLRLQGCTLNCIWCDTQEVWRKGNPYSFTSLLMLMEASGLIGKLLGWVHLVITGGSPMKQQLPLLKFFEKFKERFHFIPHIEMENECTLPIARDMITYVSCWNNSPKLSNSGNSRKARYKPEVLKTLGRLENSWFKFVVTCEEDWEEIQMDFLETSLITKSQIILMPEGATRKELKRNREIAVQMAIKHDVRYSSREHITLWDKKTGV